jgi:superfamily I DNA and/or RNA helicase
MSPLSVSDTLPLDAEQFDVVIFDEASQVTLEEAIPAIFRAKQVIVVGDEMQLPPTNFFSAKGDDDETLEVEDEQGQRLEYDLGSNSFLNHAARTMPATMLGWHYRSRSESLISYSNAAFYQGKLLTVPDVSPPPPNLGEIRAKSAADGFANVDHLLDRPLSFHFMDNGIYHDRRNGMEAAYIAQLTRGLLARDDKLSIGIVAFSEAQQSEIERALRDLSTNDAKFQARLETEWEREDDGQFAGLLVKNLENIQGDERDVIIISVCYGNNSAGKMLMNFGPINQTGGERRLNVAFSRAKQRLAIISSIRHAAITNDYNDGARCLKNYLRYAEAMSMGDLSSAGRVLREMSPQENSNVSDASVDLVTTELVAALTERGYLVDRAIGQSHFRCDLAVRRPGDLAYRTGILVDTDEYYRHANLLERDVLRPKLLRAFGWKLAHVLTKDWYQDRAGVLDGFRRLLPPHG